MTYLYGHKQLFQVMRLKFTIESSAFNSDNLLIGDNTNDTQASNAGAVHYYKPVSGVFTKQQTLYASDSHANAYFGGSVSVSDNYAIVSAHRNVGPNNESNWGAAYIFKLTNGVWQQTAKIQPSDGQGGEQGLYFGHRVSISDKKICITTQPVTSGTDYIHIYVCIY